MKRFFCFAACLALVLAGCANNTDTKQTTPSVTSESVTSPTEPILFQPAQEPMYAVSMPTTSEGTRAEDGTIIFSYTLQDITLTLPEQDVADKVTSDFRSRIASTSAPMNAVLSSAKANYNGETNWSPYLYNITYSPTRMDQGVLSLLGSCITYSGASHPERLCMAANYDLITGDVLTLGSIMSAQATTDDFCKLVLKELAKVKDAKYLYEGYEQTVLQRFSRDESQDEDWYFSTSGLCFYFVPYEIAPYSSGVIVAEIPYSELYGLLYDGYFPAERQSATGEINAIPYSQTEPFQFTQTAELVLDQEGEMVFLYTDGILWDVALEYGASDTSGANFAPVYTALFSAALSPGDAIMVQSNELSSLRLSYFNGAETVMYQISQSNGQIILIPYNN